MARVRSPLAKRTGVWCGSSGLDFAAMPDVQATGAIVGESGGVAVRLRVTRVCASGQLARDRRGLACSRDAVAAGSLGAIQGGIGGAEQRFGAHVAIR